MRTEKNWAKEMLMHFETYIGLAAFIFITVILTVQVVGRYIFGQKRLLAAFPRMRSLDHRRTLERLRRWLEGR